MKTKLVVGLLLAAAGLGVWADDAAEYPGWRILGTGATAYAAPASVVSGRDLVAVQDLQGAYAAGELRLTADILAPAKWTGPAGQGTSLRVGLASATRAVGAAWGATIGQVGPDFQAHGNTTKGFALTRSPEGHAAGCVLDECKPNTWYRYEVLFNLDRQVYSGRVCEAATGAPAGAFSGTPFCRPFNARHPIAAIVLHVQGITTGLGDAFCAADAGGVDNLKLEWKAPDADAFTTVYTCDFETRTGGVDGQPLVGRINGGKPDLRVDFTQPTGTINKWLHCAGWGPRSYPRSLDNDDADLKALHLTAARTHDWALINRGQLVVDTQYIFPLLHLDANDPRNYVFKPTDYVLELAQNIGEKIFYRLGTSIEHTGSWSYNANNPTNHAQYAEALAGIVRHYTKGWGDGFHWDIQNWEIYNEPNIEPCWRGTKEEFIHLFVTCLKRLKGEFPELNIGGPAFAGCPLDYMRDLLLACRAAGVAPDFVSWHYYGQNPDELVSQPARVRRFLDDLGFPQVKLVINEWHYIVSWDGIHGASSPEKIRKAHSGPAAHNGIDSGVFTLSVLAGFQNTPLDQSYFYGSGADGNWGWKDGFRKFNKNYYAMKIFGDIVTDYRTKVAATGGEETSVTVFAGRNEAQTKAFVLVADYRGSGTLAVNVKGLDGAKVASAVVLDQTRDAEPVDVAWKDGVLTLPRKDPYSAAFYVTFEYGK